MTAHARFNAVLCVSLIPWPWFKEADIDISLSMSIADVDLYDSETVFTD